MSCGYCNREGHNSRTCPEVPSRVFRPATERLGEAEARIAKLEDALRPFAKLGNELPTSLYWELDDRPVWGFDNATITLGELRHAREVLEEGI